jgi:hypothetical protein
MICWALVSRTVDSVFLRMELLSLAASLSKASTRNVAVGFLSNLGPGVSMTIYPGMSHILSLKTVERMPE